MLVLSRRSSEKILFPSIGISVQVLAIRGHAVKIGIEAPPDVQVLRAELASTHAAAPAHKSHPSADDRLERAHSLLALFQDLRNRGRTAEAENTLDEVFAALEGKEATSIARPTRLSRSTSVVPDILVERAGFTSLLKKDD